VNIKKTKKKQKNSCKAKENSTTTNLKYHKDSSQKSEKPSMEQENSWNSRGCEI